MLKVGDYVKFNDKIAIIMEVDPFEHSASVDALIETFLPCRYKTYHWYLIDWISDEPDGWVIDGWVTCSDSQIVTEEEAAMYSLANI